MGNRIFIFEITKQMTYKQYYSQHGQDGFLEKFFNYKKNGKFIDIGAYDGVTFSNTYYLEKVMGWRGICVEPNPQPFGKLSSARISINLNCGVGEHESKMNFLAVTGACEMLSGFTDTFDENHLNRIAECVRKYKVQERNILVPIRPLRNILAENDLYEFDYCNIDVEGGELSVLKSIDFLKTRIKLLSVENNSGTKTVNKYLKDIGYTLIEKIGADEFYEYNSRNYFVIMRYKYSRFRKWISYLKNDMHKLFH